MANAVQDIKKRKRSANWDNLEKDLLKNCMKEFVSVIENKNTDTNTNKSKTAAWQTVTKRFNELNSRQRELAEIKQQWRTMKLDAKKNMSQIKTLIKCTGGGPKPPSPNPETLDILDMIPQEFETDINEFDSDGIATKKEDSQLVHIQDSQLIHIQDFVLTPVEKKNSESQLDLGTQEFVVTEVDNRDTAKENIIPLRKTTNHFKQSGVKRKLPFNNGHRSTSIDDSGKERNEVLINCLREEHHLKMKNMAEAHNIATEEHKLKMQQMTEHHTLLKEEYNLRLEKLKLEILLLKSKGTIKE